MHVEDRVSCAAGKDSDWVQNDIVKELLSIFHCLFRGRGLLRSDSTEYVKHGCIYCTYVVEKGDRRLLDEIFSDGPSFSVVSSSVVYCIFVPYVGMACL